VFFESPLYFLLLPLVAALLWLRRRRLREPGLIFSSLDAARGLPATVRTRLRHLPLILRAAAALMVVIALARPSVGVDQIRETREGVAIQMVLDRSGSMRAEMDYDGERITRLDAVKRVFRDFVLGKGRTLEGRPNDLIGLVAFARYADTLSPLTLMHGAAIRFLDTVELVESQAEDGTAIGDALALAAARLESATRDSGGAGYRVSSKVIILLTDGIHNAGRRTPIEAARLAAAWGIRIHAIGIGGGPEFTTVKTATRTVRVATPTQIDSATLGEIARIGGGIYRDAADTAALRAVYAEIDRLEKSPVEEIRYAGWRELFTPFALLALLFLCGDVLLSVLVFRRLP
jgi:Ca-activated chloride channel family protein